MRHLRYLFVYCILCALPSGHAAALERPQRQDFVRTNRIEFPENAPYSPQATALGKMLFFDPRLSGAQNMSCMTCHNPSFGWESPVSLAIGALNYPLDRHTPTIENLAESTTFFWDGGRDSLEEQSIGPLTSPREMNAQLGIVIKRLNNIKAYRNGFETAFPNAGLTEDTLLRALATFQRTLRSGWAPFDDWVEGREDAISESAKRGFDLFSGEAQCSSCHQGWALTDHSFHNVGVLSKDPGRSAIEDGAGRTFKTPGLRNISLRAPYMHNGSIQNLRDVVEHYRGGGHIVMSEDAEISPLELSSSQVNDLLEFLQTLTAYDPHVTTPVLPVE